MQTPEVISKSVILDEIWYQVQGHEQKRQIKKSSQMFRCYFFPKNGRCFSNFRLQIT